MQKKMKLLEPQKQHIMKDCNDIEVKENEKGELIITFKEQYDGKCQCMDIRINGYLGLNSSNGYSNNDGNSHLFWK